MKNIKAVLKLRAIEALEENIRYTFTFQYKLRLLTVCLWDFLNTFVCFYFVKAAHNSICLGLSSQSNLHYAHLTLGQTHPGHTFSQDVFKQIV